MKLASHPSDRKLAQGEPVPAGDRRLKLGAYAANLLGLSDRKKRTFFFQGRDFLLTDVGGIKCLLTDLLGRRMGACN